MNVMFILKCLLFFGPLIALTVYVVIMSIREGDSEELSVEEEQKLWLEIAALRMLHMKDDTEAVSKFHQFSYSKERGPEAAFTLIVDNKKYYFKVKKGKMMRLEDRKKKQQ